MSRIVITGSKGVIGNVLVNGLRGHDIAGADLPTWDLRIRATASRLFVGVDQVVHLAWNSRSENFRSKSIDPDNSLMLRHVLEAAAESEVQRVIVASSVHADVYPAPYHGAELEPSRTPVPDSLYGTDKVFGEALGRHYARHTGLEVVSIRFGGVNRRDSPPSNDEAERAVWFSHRDCISLLQTILDQPVSPGIESCLYGVSDNEGRWHSLKNEFGWMPQPVGL